MQSVYPPPIFRNKVYCKSSTTPSCVRRTNFFQISYCIYFIKLISGLLNAIPVFITPSPHRFDNCILKKGNKHLSMSRIWLKKKLPFSNFLQTKQRRTQYVLKNRIPIHNG